jgi:predicted metal-dependent HD superfamily phosphohydrolase
MTEFTQPKAEFEVNDYSDLLEIVGDENIVREIVQRYGEPQRHYHTLEHVRRSLAELSQLTADETKGLDIELLKEAILYHDIIYDPTRNDNEEKSAEYVMDIYHDGDLQRANNIARLILATRHDHEPTQEDEKIIVDVDLAILGSDAETFSRYEEGVRQEYNMYNDEEYRMGREAVLSNFMQRKNIFCTAYFREKYETQARQNLMSSILKLRGENG